MENRGGVDVDEPVFWGVASAQVLVATFSSVYALLLISDGTFLCV